MDPNSLLANILGGGIPLLVLCGVVIALRKQERRHHREEVREFARHHILGPTVLDWLTEQYADDSKFSVENFEDTLNQFEDVLDRPVNVLKQLPPKRHNGPIWASPFNVGISQDYNYSSGSIGPIPLVGGGTAAGSDNVAYGTRSLKHHVTTKIDSSLITANKAREAMEKLVNEPVDPDV